MTAAGSLAPNDPVPHRVIEVLKGIEELNELF
jgi:hypothetical protein